MKLPRSIQSLVEEFEKLPGIGPKTAQRLTFYLLHVPQKELDSFSQALADLKRKTKVCQVCFHVDELNPCSICQEERRDKSVICVVEEPFDVLAIEKTGKYKGLYHVLGGAIRPLEDIGPEELRIAELMARVKNSNKRLATTDNTEKDTDNTEIREVILATNPDTEGEATAIYIKNKLNERGFGGKITRLARGMSTGSALEFTDDQTLGHALEGRKEY